MKLEIKARFEPIQVLGRFEPSEILPPEREVYIDGKLVPKALAEIILLGLDTATDKYLDMVEEAMKNEPL